MNMVVDAYMLMLAAVPAALCHKALYLWVLASRERTLTGLGFCTGFSAMWFVITTQGVGGGGGMARGGGK